MAFCLSFDKFSTCVSQVPRLDGSREMGNGKLSSPLSQSEAVCSGTSYRVSKLNTRIWGTYQTPGDQGINLRESQSAAFEAP